LEGSKGEEKVGRRRSKKTEEGDKYHIGERRRNGLNDNFNLTISSQFLVVADRSVATPGVMLLDKALVNRNCTGMTLQLDNITVIPFLLTHLSQFGSNGSHVKAALATLGASRP
jgi:hypothetical protein